MRIKCIDFRDNNNDLLLHLNLMLFYILFADGIYRKI